MEVLRSTSVTKYSKTVDLKLAHHFASNDLSLDTGFSLQFVKHYSVFKEHRRVSFRSAKAGSASRTRGNFTVFTDARQDLSKSFLNFFEGHLLMTGPFLDSDFSSLRLGRYCVRPLVQTTCLLQGSHLFHNFENLFQLCGMVAAHLLEPHGTASLPCYKRIINIKVPDFLHLLQRILKANSAVVQRRLYRCNGGLSRII